MTTFTHTDGRTFTYIGEAPHITRGGHTLTVKLWRTSCSCPGCAAPLVVRTVTATPQGRSSFNPAKFCETHRIDAFVRWRASPDGAAQLARLSKDRIGTTERILYEAVREHLTGGPNWRAAIEAATAALPPPQDGKRDTRRQRVLKALDRLQAKGRLHYRAGVISVRR